MSTTTTPEDIPDRSLPEDRILQVSAKGDVIALGSAIAHTVRAGQVPVLRAIGVSAVNQAVKAVVYANGQLAHRGQLLVIRPGMDTVDGARDENISATVFRLLLM